MTQLSTLITRLFFAISLWSLLLITSSSIAFAQTAHLTQTSHLAQTTASTACSTEQPINTQFRPGSSDGVWMSGSEITSHSMKPGERIDVNCFARNGFAQLPGAVIEVTLPNGSKNQASAGPSLDNYTLYQAGTYYFRCVSQTINNCADTDSLTVQALPQPSPGVSPVPSPSPKSSPTPQPSPAPSPSVSPHSSACDDLDVASGNNSLVPAKVVLRGRGSDSKGSIQRYKFYFGDGKQEESDNPEITHTYESSGSFIARVDVKDTQGNWKTSSSCEATVTVKGSSVESHKADCSDVFMTANNSGKAPSTVTFQVTGYDNKGSIQRYKLDFGLGFDKESDSGHFEQRYDKAGTYTVRAHIKDSAGNWHGGDDSCKKTLYISTQPLTTQPATGTPTLISLLGAGSGLLGTALGLARRRLHS